jgi:AcrR family transcriptional regulator
VTHPSTPLDPPRARRSDYLKRQLKVIDAYVDLVLGGDPAPTPPAIATRAGVSRASVFRYFSSLDELRNATAGRVLERFEHLFELGEPPATRDDRVSRFVASRLNFHEQLHPLALLQRRHAADSSVAAETIDLGRQLLADQLARYFRVDIEHASPARRQELVTIIAVLTSVESWDQLSRSHGRTAAQIHRAWVATILDLLPETNAPAETNPRHLTQTHREPTTRLGQ